MKQNAIWDQVKDQMIQSLTEVKDLDTEVIVVPFQDDVFEEKRVTLETLLACPNGDLG